MTAILVTDGTERSALAATRSLGRAGYTVLVAASRRRSLAGGSKYVQEEIELPDPLHEPGSFGDSIADVATTRGLDVVLPMTEAALLATLPARDRIPAVIPFPRLDRVREICDKGRVFEVARSVGIAVPDDIECETPDELSPAATTLGFPVVLKPARSVGGEPGALARHSVRHARDASELEAVAAGLPASAFPIHVQQRVGGVGVGVFLLPWHGRTLARFAHRRLREKPPSGGVSVYRESVALDPELERASARLLEAFEWDGVAMVEYRIDRGRPYLMEINGRFWGSLQLAIDAGVDFPRLLVEAAVGDPVKPVPVYRTGVRSRWFWGDVDHLLQRLLRSRRALHLSEEAGGRWSALRAFLAAFASGRPEVFRASDPKPAWRESVAWLRALGGGLS